MVKQVDIVSTSETYNVETPFSKNFKGIIKHVLIAITKKQMSNLL